jgi:hypothetical protein
VEQIAPAGVEHELKPIKAGGNPTAILELSDWHFGETVDPNTVNGMNEFTPVIAEKRAKNLFERAAMMLDFTSRFAKTETLVVALLGDFITGYIHEELQEGNSLAPVEEVLAVQDVMKSGLEFLKRQTKIKRIIIPTAIGNHGRTTHKMRIATAAKNSFEWLMYCTMARHFQIPGVEWKVEQGYHNWLDIYGKQARFHHGDAISYWGGVGGITIAVNKAISQWDKTRTARWDFFGHFHQMAVHRKWLCNSSLIGYGPYALKIKGEFEEPSQSLVVISGKNGRRILCEPVFCDDVRAP